MITMAIVRINFLVSIPRGVILAVPACVQYSNENGIPSGEKAAGGIHRLPAAVHLLAA
jgi:hypothetical protein